MYLFSYAAFLCTILGFLTGARALRVDPGSPFNRAVSFAMFVYGLWALAGVWVYGAAEPGVFWPSFHLAVFLSMLLQPVSLWINLVLCQVRFWPRVLVTLPFAVFYQWVFIIVLQKPVFYVGFKPSPFGNIGLLPEDLTWLSLVALVLLGQNVLGWILLFVARRRVTSRRVKTQITIMVYGSIAFVVIRFMKGMLGDIIELPQSDLFLGLLDIGLIYYLATKYRLLDAERLPLVHEILDVMKEAVILIGPDLRIKKINPVTSVLFAAEPVDLLGREIPQCFEKPLVLRNEWKAAVEKQRGLRTMATTVRGDEVELSLSPIFDEFKDLIGGVVLISKNDVFDSAFQHFGITPRERDILHMLIQGYQSKEIADRKFISVGTVKTHIHSIYEKTGATNRVELLMTLVGGRAQKEAG